MPPVLVQQCIHFIFCFKFFKHIICISEILNIEDNTKFSRYQVLLNAFLLFLNYVQLYLNFYKNIRGKYGYVGMGFHYMFSKNSYISHTILLFNSALLWCLLVFNSLPVFKGFRGYFEEIRKEIKNRNFQSGSSNVVMILIELNKKPEANAPGFLILKSDILIKRNDS